MKASEFFKGYPNVVKADCWDRAALDNGWECAFRVEDLGYSDYSGGTVGKANVEEWLSLYPESIVHRSAYSGRSIVFGPDSEISDEMAETLNALTDYPVISEERLGDIEANEEGEAAEVLFRDWLDEWNETCEQENPVPHISAGNRFRTAPDDCPVARGIFEASISGAEWLHESLSTGATLAEEKALKARFMARMESRYAEEVAG